MYIIVFGNPVDGIDFVGTFEDHCEATCHAETFLKNEEWWIAELESAGEIEEIAELRSGAEIEEVGEK